MANTFNVPFPDELAFLLNMQAGEFASEMRKMAIIKLYEVGKISSGKAAEMLHLSRPDFLEIIGQYRVSIFGNPSSEDLDHDLANA